MYRWLHDILRGLLPELADLPPAEEGQEFARRWFARLLARLEERGLKTPAQQKNRVVDVRNAIRERFGPDHPSLRVVGFDAPTWQQINLLGHDRAEARSTNQLFIRQPDLLAAKATSLLGGERLEELAVGLGLATGRRFVEVLDGTGVFAPESAWSIRFSGQRKRGNRRPFDYEIPTLAPAELVLAAYRKLCVMVGSDARSAKAISDRYNTRVNEAADRHFADLLPVPPPAASPELDDPANQLTVYVRLFRAAYATIAVFYYAPPKVNRITYLAEIQGHRQDLEALPTEEQRRSYTASRFYDYYQVADASGTNIDGRQGILLGKVPGLQVIKAFRHVPLPHVSAETDPAVLPTMPPDPESDSVPMATTDLPPEPATPDPGPAAEVSPESLAPADAELTGPAKRKEKQVLYRLYAPDKVFLETERRDTPEVSQADHLRRILHAFQETHTLQERLLQSETRRAEAYRRAEDLDGRLAAKTREYDRLFEALRSFQRPPAEGAAPLLAFFTKELLDLARDAKGSPLQDRLLALASKTLGEIGYAQPHLPPTSAATGAAPPRPAHSTEPSKRLVTRATPPPVIPQPPMPPPVHKAEGEPPGTAALVTNGEETARPPRRLAPARSGASTPHQRADRVVCAVMAHNDAQTSKDRKWGITESTIHRYMGGSRERLRGYFTDHQADIDAHNQRHDLGAYQNGTRGKRGDSLEADLGPVESLFDLDSTTEKMPF